MKDKSKLEQKINSKLGECLNKGENDFCKDCSTLYGCENYYSLGVRRENSRMNLITAGLVAVPAIIGGLLGYSCDHSLTNAFNGMLTLGIPGAGISAIYHICKIESNPSKWKDYSTKI